MRHSTYPDEVARTLWPADPDVELVLRAATASHTLANTPVLAQIAKVFLTTLVPVSAGADLLARGIGLTFDGAAQITLPGISVPTADFVGEGAPIPVVQSTTSPGAVLSPHKLSVITSLTGEMLRNSNAETLVRDVLMQSTGPAVDRVLFSANAAAADRPAGLLNGVAALTPAGVGEKAQAIVDDLQSLASAVAPVAGNGGITLVASPDAAVALALRMPREVTWPVLTSASLAARTVIAVAANAVVSAVEGTPQIDASQESDLQSDTAPASDGSLGTPRFSMFQKDAVGLRLRWPISWCLRTPTAIAWMASVNW
jgi:capsid protein